MKIAEFIQHLETVASLDYQEDYDNAGLLTGSPSLECTGVMISLDTTEAVVEEAIAKHCNLVISHHPIIFGGLKSIADHKQPGKTLVAAIKNDIAIYAIHTNLDNVLNGVNGKIADLLGLTDRSILAPRPGTLKKMFTFVPTSHLDPVRDAIFQAGAGNIGQYSEASFAGTGTGSFKAGEGAHPFVGKPGKRHYEDEIKLEFIFPAHLQQQVVAALVKNHPYEEAAYDILELVNTSPGIGSGLVGELEQPVSEKALLEKIKNIFGVPFIRHTVLTGKLIRTVALCGGAGSFLIPNALQKGADIFITADLKYHDFFKAGPGLLLADIGHYESEQFTIDLLQEILQKKFPTFAVLKTTTITNPVRYF